MTEDFASGMFLCWTIKQYDTKEGANICLEAEEDKAVQLLQFSLKKQTKKTNSSELCAITVISGFSLHCLKSFISNIWNIGRYWGIAISVTLQMLCVLHEDLPFKRFWTSYPLLCRMHKGKCCYLLFLQVNLLLRYRLWYAALYVNILLPWKL